jgi:hypothetical protein
MNESVWTFSLWGIHAHGDIVPPRFLLDGDPNAAWRSAPPSGSRAALAKVVQMNGYASPMRKLLFGVIVSATIAARGVHRWGVM